MDRFQCYRCEESYDSLAEIVTHCKIYHLNDCLKFRELLLDERTGKHDYRTKVCEDVVPEIYKKKIKK